MFGLGPTELIVILVLGVLLLGPQRIPEAAASLGKAIRSFRRATKELREQIDIEDEVRRPLEDLRAALRDEPPPYIPPPPPSASASPPLISPPSEQILSPTEETAPAAFPGASPYSSAVAHVASHEEVRHEAAPVPAPAVVDHPHGEAAHPPVEKAPAGAPK